MVKLSLPKSLGSLMCGDFQIFNGVFKKEDSPVEAKEVRTEVPFPQPAILRENFLYYNFLSANYESP